MTEKTKRTALRNLGGGQPSEEALKEFRFLIARDAAEALGKQEGNFSKDIKAGKVKAEHQQLFIKADDGYYPVGTKTLQVVDMLQFCKTTVTNAAETETTNP